ncbi:MAG: hypothetical protein J5U17_00015 [Candidatus Methanoperedens sp.]|nr:hypothetical protein [Candidatus Methanoperedens sp.]MCE8428297.1 hypothetical protein [Candidatus Methanoperedens sp.]
MKKNYIFWVLSLTALFSILGVSGFAFTYSQDDIIHSIGNFLFIYSSIWSMISLPITAYFLLKKVPARITLVPAVSAFMGLPFVYLTDMVLPIGADISNPISIAIDIAIAAYAVWLIMQNREN